MANAKDFPEFQGTARFEVVRRLGAGGMGVVYEALDRERNTKVALKTLRTLSADYLLRFKNEFRALQDLSHPNLVSLGELFEDRGQWFFTMEMIKGEHFLAHVRPALAIAADGNRSNSEPRSASNGDGPSTRDESPSFDSNDVTLDVPTNRRAYAKKSGERTANGFDEARLRSALAQLARGLGALHAAQKVHRDIKPSNILVTPEGRLVVLDFGLIADSKEGAPLDEELVGTLSYMAPEQTVIGPVGPEADWYAVGVMLYQALTGQLPIRGSTMKEFLVLKRALEPPPPSAHNGAIPHDLDRLCNELLRIDPKARPKGRSIMKRLDAEDEAVFEASPSSAHFVGRSTEIATLEEARRAARNGAAVAVLVHGESGVGKSALTRRFASRLNAQGERPVIFFGRCYERESVPYKAVDGVVDALARHLASLSDGEALAVLPRQAGLLGHIFPVLRRVPAIAKAPRTQVDRLDPQILRARLFHAMRELFARLATERELVLVIDDLQWADEDSMALLAEVMRPPSVAPILLLSTVRLTKDAVNSLDRLASRLGSDVRRLEVGTLPAGDARALATALLSDAGSEVPAFASAIADEANGHPLFIDELVRRKLLMGEETAPLRLDEALWSRIARLEEQARTLLTIIAIAGAPIAQERIAEAAQRDFGDLAHAIAHLRGANLVRTGGARRTDFVEPYHDRVREAVVERLDPAVRRGYHERLALSLEAAERANPEALAIHWRGAGNDEKAADYAERAATEAMSALAFDRAARLYAMSLALRESAPRSPDSDDARAFAKTMASLRARLGDALSNAGRGAEAAKAYLAAAENIEPAQSLELHRKAAEQLLRSGHINQALSAFRVVLGSIGMDLPSSSKTALAALLVRRAQVRIRGLNFRQRAENTIPPEELTRIDTCWFVGAGLGLVDTIVGSYFQSRALLLCLDAGEPRRLARAFAMEASYSSASGGRTEARTKTLLERASSLAVTLDDAYTHGWVEAATGITGTLEGRFRVGHASSERAEATFRDRCTGAAWEIGTARWFSMWSLCYLGELAEVARRVPVRLREARERGDLYTAIGHTTGLPNLVWLAEDDPTKARAMNKDALAGWSQRKFHVEHWWAMLAEAQIDLYEGRGGAARARIEQQWKDLSGSMLLLVQFTLLEALQLRARAALAAACEPRADRRALCRAAEADAAKMASERMRWADPLAALLRAGIANVLGDRALALHNLGVATQGFEGMEMALHGGAAHYRAGQIEGGDRGRALMDAAIDWFARQGVKKPERMIAMLAPGFED